MRRLRAAGARGVARAVRAAALLHAVRLLLWTVPYRWLLAAVERVPPRRRAPGGAQQVAADVRRAARTLPSSTCLVRALTAYALCRRAGVDAEICIGVAPGAGGTLEAHAWVRSGDLVLVGGHELHRYVPLRPSPA